MPCKGLAEAPVRLQSSGSLPVEAEAECLLCLQPSLSFMGRRSCMMAIWCR